ncbi:MAG: FAD-dependent oxidoreductase [Clostridiales bacterium]|jgi:hypothetical protein|nr:FAD-dependent oxidoreductase [Clostridiales bacterium]
MDYEALKHKSLFLEAGAFTDYGGWVRDTQFIPNIGSAYLLAHGLGVPVKDARHTAVFPACGKYRAWAFTRDWVASWKKGVAPGLFEVLVNGEKLPAVFGSENENWHWQYGGEVEITSADAEITLRDLTGFEGRCAALFFTPDAAFVPPADIAELTAFRRVMNGFEGERDCGAYDVIVAGGGIAGICAALSGARSGLRVALVQDRPVVGGNNSSEARVWLGGKTNFEPFPRVGDIVAELEQEKSAHYGKDNIGALYEDEKKMSLLTAEKNITLFMEQFLTDARVEDGAITSVTVMDTRSGEYKRLTADLFVDATGDAVLGAAAGADFEITTNGHMGMTNVWYVEDTGEPQRFPRCPWAIDLTHCEFPGRKDGPSTYGQTGEIALGGWYWESGCEHDPIEKAEYARDTNFRAMYGAWDCIKNVDDAYKNYRLGNACYIGGKRESRRLLGDVILTKSDVYGLRVFEDACVPATWNFDVHYPDRKFYPCFHEGDGFLTKDYHEEFQKPYFLPYRCLYSRNVTNLFMAGRNVSVTHDALGAVRVMRTGGMMGEVIGKAAALCKKYGETPRAVYTKHLKEFLDSCK